MGIDIGITRKVIINIIIVDIYVNIDIIISITTAIFFFYSWDL